IDIAYAALLSLLINCGLNEGVRPKESPAYGRAFLCLRASHLAQFNEARAQPYLAFGRGAAVNVQTWPSASALTIMSDPCPRLSDVFTSLGATS
ncbi:hypothetical protein RYF45_16595, partial [Pseudomonas syringae pv. actinidiae]|nr:hypothetical protein [Pseudomonas syringae pv. actinidiae]